MSHALHALGVNGDRASAREAQGRQLDRRLGGRHGRRARLLLGARRARARAHGAVASGTVACSQPRDTRLAAAHAGVGPGRSVDSRAAAARMGHWPYPGGGDLIDFSFLIALFENKWPSIIYLKKNEHFILHPLITKNWPSTVRSEEWPAWFSFWFSGCWRALAKGTAWAGFYCAILLLLISPEHQQRREIPP